MWNEKYGNTDGLHTDVRTDRYVKGTVDSFDMAPDVPTFPYNPRTSPTVPGQY